MSIIKLKKIIEYALYIIFFNIIFALFLYQWVTYDDLHNINMVDTPLNIFINLFYYSMTSFTSTGDGDLYAKSIRMKLCSSLFMVIIFSILFSY